MKKKIIRYLVIPVITIIILVIILYFGRDYFKDTFLASYVYVIQKQVSRFQTEKKEIQNESTLDKPDIGIINEDNRSDIKGYIDSLSRSNAEIYTPEDHIIRSFSDIEEYTLGETGNDTIYPGCIIRGDSLYSLNQYVPLNTGYDNLEIYSNINGTDKKYVDKASFSEVSDAISEYIDKYAGDDVKEWKYYLQKIDTIQQLDAIIGIKAFSASYKRNRERSSVAVIFQKVYFSVIAEPKSNVSEYFPDGTDISILGNYEPAYVSSVDYGNRVVVLVDGEMNSSALESRVSGIFKNASIGAGLKKIYSDSELNCKMFGYGGKQIDLNSILVESKHDDGIVDKWNNFWNGSDADESIEKRITEAVMGEYIYQNPVPISYTLKYLSDNSYVDCKVLNSATIIDENKAVTVYISKDEIEKYNMEGTFDKNVFPLHIENGSYDIVVLKDLSDKLILYYKGLFSTDKKKELSLKIGRHLYELDMGNQITIEVKPGINIYK